MKKAMKWLAAGCLSLLASSVMAVVKSEAVQYEHDGKKLTGYLYYGYTGARHAFTNPDATKYGVENLKYDEKAGKRSWAQMQAFFAELFK